MNRDGQCSGPISASPIPTNAPATRECRDLIGTGDSSTAGVDPSSVWDSALRGCTPSLVTSPEADLPARRVRLALDLFELAEMMLRQRVRRTRPDASEAEIEAAVERLEIVPGLAASVALSARHLRRDFARRRRRYGSITITVASPLEAVEETPVSGSTTEIVAAPVRSATTWLRCPSRLVASTTVGSPEV